jgi:hypothetical protein
MKVTIIGKGDGWEDAPVEGESWGITDLILRRDVNRVIDMHWYSDIPKSVNAKKRAEEIGASYFSCDNYPLDEVIEHFNTDYLSCSLAGALAMAVMEGYDEIDLYGCNLEADGEYAFEKPGADFWCGVAIGKGVKLRVFGERSTLMRTRDGLVYGFCVPQTRCDNGAI